MASSSGNGDVDSEASHLASVLGLTTKLQTVCSHFLHPFIRLDPLPSRQGTATTRILVQRTHSPPVLWGSWPRSKRVKIFRFWATNQRGINDQVQPSNEESSGLRYGCFYWVQSYTHSLYISDLSASGPLKSDSDEWWWLVTVGGSGRRSYSGFYLNGRKCDPLLLMQDVGSRFLALLAMFIHVCRHTPMCK